MRAYVRLASAAVLLLSCGHTRNELSGPDGKRINAVELQTDAIADDTVDPREGDATDWRFLEVTQVGELDVELHWDSQTANLSLELYDALGKRVATGDTSAPQGRLLKYAIESKGRYYVKVEAEGEKAGSSYSLKALFKRTRPERCHDCTEGQTLCIAKDALAICKKTEAGCNAWTEIASCDPDQSCKNGVCAAGCEDQCKPDERRCSASDTVQICKRTSGGCMQWGTPTLCPKNNICDRGRCRRKKKTGKPPPKQVKETFVSGKIVTMYTRDGRRTLHIEIGENKGVRAGMTGNVLKGSSNDPVSNGQFKVVRVSGRFAIAETALEAIGNNRRVRIRLR